MLCIKHIRHSFPRHDISYLVHKHNTHTHMSAHTLKREPINKQKQQLNNSKLVRFLIITSLSTSAFGVILLFICLFPPTPSLDHTHTHTHLQVVALFKIEVFCFLLNMHIRSAGCCEENQKRKKKQLNAKHELWNRNSNSRMYQQECYEKWYSQKFIRNSLVFIKFLIILF